MLFYAPEFIFIFLPATLAGFYLLGHYQERLAFLWLAAASMFFYSYWSITYLPLICASIIGNYGAGTWITRLHERSDNRGALLVRNLSIAVNLALLGYFKYLIFGVQQLNWILGAGIDVGSIVLPIGISFYIFTQIAFLVDASRGEVKEKSFVSYLLFVTYFPHLIAGPILHHKEMMPQFADKSNLRLRFDNLAMGLTFFSFGLFKKIVLADGAAALVGPVFDAQAAPLPVDAWCAAVAYTLQIYFDFSGYSDMAVGLSLMFNVRLPINFYSPYQASSIIEFWRRWHMTLSRFLRDYLYFGLGGNRQSKLRRYANLLVTMLLGGLWHGANWTFIAWGGLHGLYLCINHAWRGASHNLPRSLMLPDIISKPLSVLLTLLAVVIAWVFFRAPDFGTATHILGAMAQLPENLQWGKAQPKDALWLAVLLAWALFAPNTNRVMNYRFGSELAPQAHSPLLAWRPSIGWASTIGIALFAAAVVGATSHEKLEFLYFQF
jgi:alginate O-acetyltransferase complex protein AlgI